MDKTYEFHDFDFINDLFLDMIDDNKCMIRESNNIREYVFIGLDSNQNCTKIVSILNDWNIGNFHESSIKGVISIYSKEINDFFINTFTRCQYNQHKHLFELIKDERVVANYEEGCFFIIDSRVWCEIQNMLPSELYDPLVYNTDLIKQLLKVHLGIENHYIGHADLTISV